MPFEKKKKKKKRRRRRSKTTSNCSWTKKELDSLINVHSLLQRNVVRTTYCPNCNSDCEDTVHALWGCQSPEVVLYGKLMMNWRSVLDKKFNLFADFLEVVFLMSDRVDVNLIARWLWLIWNRRNFARLGQSVTEYHQIPAKALLLDYQSDHVQEQRVSSERTRAVRWIPPISPLYKINYDGAIFSDLGAAGLGVVIRDPCGHVILELCQNASLSLPLLQLLKL